MPSGMRRKVAAGVASFPALRQLLLMQSCLAVLGVRVQGAGCSCRCGVLVAADPAPAVGASSRVQGPGCAGFQVPEPVPWLLPTQPWPDDWLAQPARPGCCSASRAHTGACGCVVAAVMLPSLGPSGLKLLWSAPWPCRSRCCQMLGMHPQECQGGRPCAPEPASAQAGAAVQCASVTWDVLTVCPCGG